jgi:DNA-directed RNA polymerase specialized sigma24 family protein
MIDDCNCVRTSLIPPQPMPEGAQEFSYRVHGLLDNKAKDEATVKQALDGMEYMLDAIAARLYNLASMLVGEGEASAQLVETAVVTADVSGCNDANVARMSSRRALVMAALELISMRDPRSLAAPEASDSMAGCIEDDDNPESLGVTKLEFERMMAGPGRSRVRAWLERLPTDVRTVFVLRAVAGFSADETALLLAKHGGPLSAGWTADSVRVTFRLGLCSLATQLFKATVRQ